MNLFDYLIWRKDLTFAQDPFREVDSLLLCCLSYIRFEHVFYDEQEELTLAQAAKRYAQLSKEQQLARVEEDRQLLQAMADSPRYRSLRLTQYVTHFDVEQEEQFSAITFLNDSFIFCAFRGTDNTLVGWKEDFNMTFLDTIPSQKEAYRYVQKIASLYKGKLYLGGHSKGGNLAVYAAAHANQRIQKRFVAVYNHDGPGFSEKEIKRDGYQRIVKKIHTIVPQSSIVGMLLEHEEAYTIIHSSQISLWQHDPYSWCVEGPAFAQLEQVNRSSRILDATLKTWIQTLPAQQRSSFVDAIFAILYATNATSLKEINANKLRNTAIILKALQAMDEADKKVMLNTVLSFLSSAYKTTTRLIPSLEQAKKEEN